MTKELNLSKDVNNSIILTPSNCTTSVIRNYFQYLLTLSKSGEAYPVNLEDVFYLVYNKKSDAVESLKKDNVFLQGVDYQVLRQNPQNLFGGRPKDVYKLSIPCLEYFIARKVRPVFEVYRQVFHKVVTGKKEVIYTESEIKKLLTEADRLVSENINKSNRLEDLNKHLKSNFDAIKQLYQDELIYKCNIVAYLYSKGLYQEWEAHYNSLK